jgi:hypothetical protein
LVRGQKHSEPIKKLLSITSFRKLVVELKLRVPGEPIDLHANCNYTKSSREEERVKKARQQTRKADFI